jgi:hypothetical protein
MRKMASIYQRRGKLYICAVHQTDNHVAVDEDDAIVVDGVDPAAAAAALLKCFERAQVNFPFPGIDYKISKMYRLAGVSSQSAFTKIAKSVSADWSNGAITLTPLDNRGPRFGYYYINKPGHVMRNIDDYDPVTIETRDDDPNLGNAIYQSIDMSTIT